VKEACVGVSGFYTARASAWRVGFVFVHVGMRLTNEGDAIGGVEKALIRARITFKDASQDSTNETRVFQRASWWQL
jgi:hypothetical protein